MGPSQTEILAFGWILCFQRKCHFLQQAVPKDAISLHPDGKAQLVQQLRENKPEVQDGLWCSLRGGEKAVKPLFIFSSPERSTRLFPDLILSVSSQTLLLFPLNFRLCHYLYFCRRFYLLGRVKRPTVMGTVTSFFLFFPPNHRVGFHHL